MKELNSMNKVKVKFIFGRKIRKKQIIACVEDPTDILRIGQILLDSKGRTFKVLSIGITGGKINPSFKTEKDLLLESDFNLEDDYLLLK